MKMCSITSHVLLYVILVFFSRSSCFIVTYNPVRTSKSVAPVSFIRHCRTSLYQDLNGRSNLDIASTDKGNNLKSMKSINFSQKTIIAAVSVAALAITAVVSGLRIDFDFATLLERSLLKIESLGSLGYIYFALIYVAAEVICVPAIPLAASSGYLFGLVPGFITVLLSATIAACISFFIGRTLLRGWAQKIASGSEKWRVVDAAIGREGFKVILLLRITPLFPFSIVNYLYGITSVNFWSYFAATLVGFSPGTLAIVYAGTAGKAIFSKGLGDYPWYFYVVAGCLSLFLGKTVTKVATDTMKSIESDYSSSLPTDDDEAKPADGSVPNN